MEEIIKPKHTRSILEIIETVFISMAFCIVIYLAVAIPNKVEGSSMEPNFNENDLLITNKTIQYLGKTNFGQSRKYDYKRGDVIIIHHNNTDIIKRIVALEGEVVEIKNNYVYINGDRLLEDYLSTTTRTKLPNSDLSTFRTQNKLTVPEDSYFVLGDNREESKDSRFREIGFIMRQEIRGKVVFRYWPLQDFGIIHNGTYSVGN